MEYDINKLAQKIKTINTKVLKSNLRQLIGEKYTAEGRGLGWREEVAELLQIKLNTFSSMINQAHPSRISMEQLLYVVDKLELNIDDVLANNKVIKSTQGRYGNVNQSARWTKETKTQFLIDYATKDVNYMTNKYNLTAGTIETYAIEFRKKIKIL